MHVETVQYLDQTKRPRVETSMEGQSASVLLHHGPGVPPPAAAEQVQGGQGLDVGHTACTRTEAVTETVCQRKEETGSDELLLVLHGYTSHTKLHSKICQFYSTWLIREQNFKLFHLI